MYLGGLCFITDRKSSALSNEDMVIRVLEAGVRWIQYREKGNILGLRYHPLLSYSVRRNINPRNAPEITKWANALLSIKPGDKGQLFLLDNLGLIAQLLILSKRGGK